MSGVDHGYGRAKARFEWARVGLVTLLEVLAKHPDGEQILDVATELKQTCTLRVPPEWTERVEASR